MITNRNKKSNFFFLEEVYQFICKICPVHNVIKMWNHKLPIIISFINKRFCQIHIDHLNKIKKYPLSTFFVLLTHKVGGGGIPVLLLTISFIKLIFHYLYYPLTVNLVTASTTVSSTITHSETQVPHCPEYKKDLYFMKRCLSLAEDKIADAIIS